LSKKVLDGITISFLEEEIVDPETKKSGIVSGHKRMETDDFLVRPGDAVERTNLFLIEGIPEKFIIEKNFLQEMEEKVFEGVPLVGITILPTEQQSNMSMHQPSLEIRFKVPQNIQRLPKIAMKLKRFLKNKKIPPHLLNKVTLQVSHEEQVSDMQTKPVVGLIFKGVPKNLLESNGSLYKMESEVFTGRYPIRLMEPNEADLTLRITLKNPIRKEEVITSIVQQLKKFLSKQGIDRQSVNDIVVMSIYDGKPQTDQPESLNAVNQKEYVGIEIENLPPSIINSDKQLEEIERRVFLNRKVVNINVIDFTLRISFGVPADSKDIEKAARELKRCLSKMKVPMRQVNGIIIAPHTEETWRQ